MARLDEIGEGIAAILLGSPQPEPLPLSFSGHSSVEIAFLVRAVVAACERLGRPLVYVRLPGSVMTILRHDASPEGLGVVILETTNADRDAVEFGRFPIGG